MSWVSMMMVKGKMMQRGLKALSVAAVGAAAMALATPAGATAIYLDKGEMFNPVSVAFLNNPGNSYPTHSSVLAAPILFTANYGTTASATTFTFLGFCVDIFDTISPGINVPGNINQAYQTDTLTDNNGTGSTFHTIDAATLIKIKTLVNFGTALWNTDALTDPSHNVSATVANQLAAVQGAIWEIENPGLNVDGPSAVDALITSYELPSFFSSHSAGNITVVIDSGGSPLHQAFAFASNVPEPSTWAMMIAGFGGVGAMMRRRNRAAFA
jgi:hypothetical protein